MKLKISDELSLPIEAVTQTFAILAKRGVGKTYTGAVLTEEMLKAGQQVVVADPVGVWWGLRSSADGKQPGYPIVVFGGEHGDVPLEEHAGEIVCSAIIEHGFSAVLDLSLFRKGQQVRFMTAFAETLYRLNRKPLHFLVDEADAFAPQRPQNDEARMLGAFEDIVRRGRARGLGVTLITQRAAVINKNVLTQIEVMVALRTISPQDRDALQAWVEIHGTAEQQKELFESLASLPIGTAWFWSPGWLDIFQRVKIRARQTFDSSSTPKVGEVIKKPKALAEVNLDMLGAQIKATAEKARENDPTAAKRIIMELRSENTKLKNAKPIISKAEVKEVPVLVDTELRHIKNLIDTFRNVERNLSGVRSIIERLENEVSRFTEIVGRNKNHWTVPASIKSTTPPLAMPPLASVPKRQPREVPANGTMSAGERKVMIAAAQYPDGISRETLKVLTGYRATSLYEYSRALVAKACLENDGQLLKPTEYGINQLGSDYEPLPTGAALIEHWRRTLSGGELKIFELVIRSHPNPVTKELIETDTGFRSTSIYEYTRLLKSRRIVVAANGSGIIAAKEFFE